MTEKITNEKKSAGQDIAHVQSPAEFGRLIRRARKEQGLTLEAVYAATGLTTRFLSEFERGKSNASLGGALQAAQALGLEVVLVPRAELRRIRIASQDLNAPADGER